MPQKSQKPALTDLINEWMRGDPLLCQHFKWEWPKTKGVGVGLECFFVGTHWREDTGSYAVGFVGTSPSKIYVQQVATWEWEPKFDGQIGRRKSNIYYTPEDPLFFQNFKQGLIAGHNSLSHILKCTI